MDGAEVADLRAWVEDAWCGAPLGTVLRLRMTAEIPLDDVATVAPPA